MYAQLKTKGLELIAINSTDDRATIEKYRKDSGFTFLIGMSDDGAKHYGIAEKYGVQAYPTNYVVSPDGKVVWRGVGFDEAKIREALAKLGVK